METFQGGFFSLSDMPLIFNQVVARIYGIPFMCWLIFHLMNV